MMMMVLTPQCDSADTHSDDGDEDDDDDDSSDDVYSKELVHAQSGIFITVFNAP